MELLFEIDGDADATYVAPDTPLFAEPLAVAEPASAIIPAHHINVELVARLVVHGGRVSNWRPALEIAAAELVDVATNVVLHRAAITCADLSQQTPRSPCDLNAARNLLVRPLPRGAYKLKLMAKWQGSVLPGAAAACGSGIRLNVDGRPVWGQVYEPVPQNPQGEARPVLDLVSLNP